MFIRRTTTRRAASGEVYHTYRLVESRREGGRVRQVTLINLGRHFDLTEEHWPGLCARLAQRLGSQGALVALDLPEAVETLASTLAAQFVDREPSVRGKTAEFVEVDVDSLELSLPRSVGVEHVGLHALALLEFEPLLASLGINATTRSMILAQVVARMAAPASERATWGWLTETSALGELLDLSFTDLSVMRLYPQGARRIRKPLKRQRLRCTAPPMSWCSTRRPSRRRCSTGCGTCSASRPRSPCMT